MKQIGNKALESLRIEKGYGIWSTEFTSEYTPAMCGLDKFIDFEKGNFIGRAAALLEQSNPPKQRLVQLVVDVTDADSKMLDPVYDGDKWVGFVTSGAFGHHTGLSLALAYVDQDVAVRKPKLTVHVIGEPKTARILDRIVYDPDGKQLRL
jgi:dimethylglycine dehydrogenase